MRLSIVIPVLNEDRNIPLLYEQVGRSSIRRSRFRAHLRRRRQHGRVRGENPGAARGGPARQAALFSRNFGHQIALTAGMDHASGDAVIVMDADLQHPPA